MRVGVVDAVHRDLLDVGAEELAREHRRLLGIEAVLADDALADDPLLHEHLVSDVRMDHRRHDQVLGIADDSRDQLRAVRLLDEVELGGEMRLELVGQRRELQQPRRLGPPLGERGQRAQQLQVERDLLLDPRSAHLDHDLATRAQQATVDLGDRCAGEWPFVEPREDLEPDLLVDDPARLLERERRHVVDEVLELVDVDVREQVRP